MNRVRVAITDMDGNVLSLMIVEGDFDHESELTIAQNVEQTIQERHLTEDA